MMNHSYNDKKKYNPYSRLKFKNFGMKIWALTMLMLFGLQSISVKSQQYPVKLVPVVIPPYSMRLGDYATSTDNKLQLQVLMTDLMEPQHQTGIKFTLESGLNAVPLAQSNDFVVGMNPFTLFPGSNITLTNVDLRALFELQNLGGINAVQYAQPLSDGVYQFCFQAYDYYTKNNLSSKTCATVFLTQYDPPMLNLPQNAEIVQAVSPYAGGSGILFQWMPRQIANNTRYIFTLKELWDSGQSPVSGFLSSPPLWQEETYAPTLYYGLDKTQLIPGKRYAWQVQAKSGNPVLGANPTEDNGVYKNNGFSEIYYFDYVENCTIPTFLMAKNVGRGRVEISWSIGAQPAGLYQVQYRKKNSNTEWMTQQSYQSPAILTGLEDLTEYEYRVGSVCGNTQDFGNAYSYSAIQYFTTNANDVDNNYQCGVMPAIDIANKNLYQGILNSNDTFTAGDFPVTVISSEGSNGIYSGTGYIPVPYLESIKIKVSFENISINTDKKLIDGIVETTYDPTEQNVISIGDILNDLGNLFTDIIAIIDDAIGNGGMSPSDFDDLSGNIGTYTGQSGTVVSNLFDQGLVDSDLKDQIQTEKDKIDSLLQNLNCTKDDKGKGSNEDFKFEDECTEKLKELKALLENYQNLINQATANACIWDIEEKDNLKGKTFYFQRSTKDRVAHKLKAGDYPLSFNRLGNVYSFISNGKIFQPCTDGNYYTIKGQDCVENNYAFESPSTIIIVEVDETADDKVKIDGQEVIAQKDCSIDGKDKGKGLGKGVLFTKTVDGKYKVSVSKKGDKLASTFKLIGTSNKNLSEKDRTDIEQEVQNTIDDALKDLNDPNDINSLSKKPKVEIDGFYVKQMTGKEWVTTLSDLGTNVWENATLPKDYWKQDEAGHNNSNIKMPALFAGVSDGGIELVSDYPQLIKMGYDVATKEEVRTGIWNGVKTMTPSKMADFAEGAIKTKWENYNFSDKPYMGNHELGKDGVAVVKFALGAGALVKGIKETGEKFAKVITEFFENINWKKGKAIWKSGKLSEHFNKHVIERKEFGNISMDDYHNEMVNFLNESSSNFKEVRIGNQLIKYDPNSKRILIGHAKDREVKSFYKALPEYTTIDPLTDAIDVALKETGLTKADIIYK